MKINLKMTGKSALVLTDFRLPLRYVLPTINGLAKNNNKVIVIAFFGEQSLAEVAAVAAKSLNRKFIDLPQGASRLPEYDIPHVYFLRESALLRDMRHGDIAVVENLNLLPHGEVSALARLADVFVNDDFSADQDKIVKFHQNLPVGHGLTLTLLEKRRDRFLSSSKKPIVLILGGLRLAGQEVLLDKLIARADTVLVGGGVANLFFKLRDWEIGQSTVDGDADRKAAKKILRDYGAKIKLPMDVIVALGSDRAASCKSSEKVKAGEMILDVGPQTTLDYSKYIKQAKTLIWCGALGRVETSTFRHGTLALLRLAASRPSKKETIFAASGEAIVNLLEKQGYFDDLDLVLPETGALLKALTR